MPKTLNNLQQFATACVGLSQDQIYELFEDRIENWLRNEILNLAPVCAVEPVRYALNQIGQHYKVQSLIDY
jgi:hypothetical protein